MATTMLAAETNKYTETVWSPDGTQIAHMCADGIGITDVETNEFVRLAVPIKNAASVHPKRMAWSANGWHIMFLNLFSQQLEVHNVHTQQLVMQHANVLDASMHGDSERTVVVFCERDSDPKRITIVELGEIKEKRRDFIEGVADFETITWISALLFRVWTTHGSFFCRHYRCVSSRRFQYKDADWTMETREEPDSKPIDVYWSPFSASDDVRVTLSPDGKFMTERAPHSIIVMQNTPLDRVLSVCPLGTILQAIKNHGNWRTRTFWAPNSKLLAMIEPVPLGSRSFACGSREITHEWTLRVFDVMEADASKSVVYQHSSIVHMCSVAWAPDSQRLVIGCCDDHSMVNELHLVDLQNQTAVLQKQMPWAKK